jgi:hypothetical protein
MSAKRKTTPSAHATLDQLRQAAAAERVKQRELQAELEAAKGAVDRASDEITEAYAAENQRAVTTARKAEQTAVAQVRELQHRIDAAAIRVGRAQAEADAFQAEHARELLDEREAEARTLAEELTRTGLEAVRLHRAYRDIRTDIDGLVAAVPGATSRADGPEPTHPWEDALQGLARAIQDAPEVPPPLPRWNGLKHREQQDNANRIEQMRRRGELSADDQAALALGRVVTVK